MNARLPLQFESNLKRLAAVTGAAGSLKKELALYEVNLHSHDGAAKAAGRLPPVAGIASGSALAKTMLDTLSRGVRNQRVYTLSGFARLRLAAPSVSSTNENGIDVRITRETPPLTGKTVSLIMESWSAALLTVAEAPVL